MVAIVEGAVRASRVGPTVRLASWNVDMSRRMERVRGMGEARVALSLLELGPGQRADDLESPAEGRRRAAREEERRPVAGGRRAQDMARGEMPRMSFNVAVCR